MLTYIKYVSSVNSDALYLRVDISVKKANMKLSPSKL